MPKTCPKKTLMDSIKKTTVLKSSALNMVKGGLNSPVINEENNGADYAGTSTQSTSTIIIGKRRMRR